MELLPSNPLLEDGALENPFPALAELRRKRPVFYCEKLEGWLLTRYEDIAAAFRHPNVIAGNFAQQVENYMHGRDLKLVEDYLRIRTKMMLHNDGREQLRLRRPCTSTFSQHGLDVLKPAVDQAVAEVMKTLPQNQSWDFATEFAEPLSTLVIAGIFDVPHSDRKDFQRYSDDVSRFFGTSLGDIEEDAKAANTGILFLESYFQDLMRQRRHKPGQDLLSLLITANRDTGLSDEEIIAQCVLIMMAGHFTVIDQLCNSAHTLLSHNQWSFLADNLHLLTDTIEESIRFDGGVLFMARTANSDIQMGGQTIKEGDTLFLGLGAANRDPDVFENPDRFDLQRRPTQHMGFGFGAHQCIGLGLARIEMHEALQQLMKRYPHLQLDASTPSRRKFESLFFRGFYSLHVKASK